MLLPALFDALSGPSDRVVLEALSVQVHFLRVFVILSCTHHLACLRQHHAAVSCNTLSCQLLLLCHVSHSFHNALLVHELPQTRCDCNWDLQQPFKRCCPNIHPTVARNDVQHKVLHCSAGATLLRNACLQATIAEQQPQFGQVMQQLLERYAPLLSLLSSCISNSSCCIFAKLRL